jgi:cytochrome c553
VRQINLRRFHPLLLWTSFKLSVVTLCAMREACRPLTVDQLMVVSELTLRTPEQLARRWLRQPRRWVRRHEFGWAPTRLLLRHLRPTLGRRSSGVGSSRRRRPLSVSEGRAAPAAAAAAVAAAASAAAAKSAADSVPVVVVCAGCGMFGLTNWKVWARQPRLLGLAGYRPAAGHVLHNTPRMNMRVAAQTVAA